MKFFCAIFCWPVLALAQLEFTPSETPPCVFAGSPQQVRAGIRNAGNQDAELDVVIRVEQLTAATSVPVGSPQPWKKLRVLARQTVLEDLPVNLPAVRAPVRFGVNCPGIGKLLVQALPADYLKRVRELAGEEEPVGVFDPEGKLRAVLKAAGIEFTDFETEPRDVKLGLVVAEKLPESVRTRLRKGMAVVQFKLARTPAVYVKDRLVISPPVDATTAAGQMNLVRCAELALTPELE